MSEEEVGLPPAKWEAGGCGDKTLRGCSRAASLDRGTSAGLWVPLQTAFRPRPGPAESAGS